MIIEYIFRPRGNAFSIEKVFDSIIKSVLKRDGVCVIRSEPSKCKVWPIAMMYNIVKYGLKSYSHKRLFHITGDVQYLACLMNPRNTILTIHDLVPLRNQSVPWYSKKLCYWLWYYFPLKRLRSITCISEATKQDLLSFFPWAESKVVVIPDPVDESFVYSPKVINVDNPRILHVGTKENKNLLRVISALDGKKGHLRIVGKLKQEQQSALEKSSIEYSNVFGISDEQLIQEYKDADLISFPSTFEGFGMPIIEGQAVGRPVITSNIEPMVSVAADAAILVDPFNIESIREGFLGYKDSELQDIIKKGILNANQYSSDNIANTYIKLYNQLCIIS